MQIHFSIGKYILFALVLNKVKSEVGVFNAALNKQTYQVSTLYSQHSGLAVDGFKTPYDNCASTERGDHNWWAVDLNDIYQITEVRITNRADCCANRLYNFAVYGSIETRKLSDANDLQLCGHQPTALPEGTTKNFSCLMDKRYIIVNKTKTNNDIQETDLELCEVEVIAKCPGGKYGDNCQQDCPQNCLIPIACNRFTGNGNCQNGECKAGYVGQQCLTTCQDGTYGDRCKFNCSQNCFDLICDKHTDTGKCIDGICKPGYIHGGNCTTECPGGKYGDNCQMDCSQNCLVPNACDITNGICKNRQCKAGYHGEICLKPCPDGTYGDRCKFNCSQNCFNSCDKHTDTGMCNGGKCKLGYVYGGNCTTKCPGGTYGTNCTDVCSQNCLNPKDCDIINGNCSNGECKSGYQGAGCTEICPNGTYGDRCKLNCSQNCLHSCDKHTAACIDSKCKPGYMYGGTCTKECFGGKYGDNCQQNCPSNCLTPNACDPIHGNCPSGLCKAGYDDADCSLPCPSGKYGENCRFNCSQNCMNTCDKTNGWCENGCKTGFTGDKCDSIAGAVKTDTSPVPIAGVAGGVAAGVLLVIVAVIIMVWLKRRGKPRKQTEETAANINNEDKKQTNIYQNAAMSSLINEIPQDKTTTNHVTPQKPPDAPKPSVRVKPIVKSKPVLPLKQDIPKESDSYANVEKSATAMDVKDMGTYIAQKKEENEPFQEEYERLPNNVYPWNEAIRPALKIKNRYKNIYPYDNNRVLLEQIGQDILSTYINASYVKDYNGDVSYIAALGTTTQTINDFWRMIWEQNVSLIIMVTNLVEDDKLKCEKYWPSEGLCHYDGITVLMEEELIYPSYTVRTMKATKGSDSRRIVHYQYTAWPDKSAPQDMQSLFKIREAVKSERNQHNVPILIHCSAGVGRTGTMIAIDILLDQAAKEKQIDIYKCVEMLRSQRSNMVQTLIQYVFIHDALHEMLTIGSTIIPCSYLSSTLFSSASGKAKLSKQFEFLSTIRPKYADNDMILGTTEYKEKNRDMAVIPHDNKRVKSTYSPETYINAVFVNGYMKKNAFIATQIPLSNTVVDFWKMIYEKKCRTIVCMETDSEYQEWYSQSRSSQTFDDLVVTTSDIDITDIRTTHVLQIGKFNATEYANIGAGGLNILDVKMYTIKGWSDKRNPDVLRNFINDVNDERKEENKGVSTIIICRDGATECGLYITASWLMDMASAEHEIDVFNIVKQIRITRPQFVPTFDQYEFLHKIVQEYTNETEDYVNITPKLRN